MAKEIYAREPLRFEDDIPIFSEINEYIKNYEKISNDHVKEIARSGKNPFMEEDLWVELENSTKDLITKYSSGGKILDVGVGLGRLLNLLPSSFDKYGLDISMDYLKISKTKGIDVCYSLIEEAPYKNEIFDIVVCTDVLEHIFDLNLVCIKILSFLKQDAFLIVRVPYREKLSGYLAPSYPYEYVHLRNFDEYSLIMLFEKILGCKVIEHQVVGHAVSRKVLRFGLPSFMKLPFCGLIYSTKFISKNIYKFLVEIFFNPSEINVVVRKRPDKALDT